MVHRNSLGNPPDGDVLHRSRQQRVSRDRFELESIGQEVDWTGKCLSPGHDRVNQDRVLAQLNW